MATVSDLKIPVQSPTNSTQVAYYKADIKSTSDYYPFGMLMPGRSQYTNEYRYGFNGKEKISEWSGTENEYDFGARIYDARVNRWLSLDPLAVKYPELSPYQYCANNPIAYKDPDGRKIFIAYLDESGSQQYYEYTGTNTYLGNNQFIMDAIGAMEESKDYGGGKYLMSVVNDEKVVTIYEASMDFVMSKKPEEGMRFDPTDPNKNAPQNPDGSQGSRVMWKSDAGGIDAANGVGLSSTRGLFHEIIHGLHFFKHPKQFVVDRETPDFQYEQKEDRKTIRVENKIFGRFFGKRGGHDGSPSMSAPPCFVPPTIDSPVKTPDIDNNTKLETNNAT